MRSLVALIGTEFRKAIRSRVPLLTAVLFLLIPLAMALMMVILKDPEFAQRVGLLSAKAQMIAGDADWPTFLSMMGQGIAIAGIFLFSLVISWVFGREFADGTVKDLLAVPVPRPAILLAKFAVTLVWCLALAVLVAAVGLPLGVLIGLPGGGSAVLVQGTLRYALTALMVLIAGAPVALFASAGRGYLLPMGIVFMLLVVSQLVAVIGYGAYFPWSIPGIYAGFSEEASLVPASYWIVALTGLAGIAGTLWWWQRADQS